MRIDCKPLNRRQAYNSRGKMIAQNKDNKAEITEIDGKTPLKGKREKFAQLYATDTKNHTECARGAGYKDNKGLRRYAHDLAHNPNILTRSAYLRAELAKKWEISKDSQVQQYIGIRDRAIAAGDLRAEISANNSIDKLCGLIVDKVQHEQTDAQRQRAAIEQQHGAEWAKICLERSLARPEGLEEVNVVDITEDNSLVSSSIGCSDDDNSGLTGQEQG